MKYIISRYNHDIGWLEEYSEDWVMYDRSDVPIDDPRVIITANRGSDLYDKFTYIIDNYDNLPDVVLLTKANLFKYITKEEFEEVKDNKTFTPLLTKNHETKMCHWDSQKPFSFYHDGIYWEINGQVQWLYATKCNPYQLMAVLGIRDMKYTPFAPGSNYTLPKENILKHPKETYEALRESVAYDVYPPEAMIIERGIYTFWK
jgi:hypothetical protein